MEEVRWMMELIRRSRSFPNAREIVQRFQR